MKRLGFLVLFVAASTLVGARVSHADDGTPNPIVVVQCPSLADGTLVYCVASPTPSGIPTHAPIASTKSLNIGGPISGAAGVTEYPVTVTSQLVCFSLNEPVSLNVLGSPGAGVLTPLSPSTNLSYGPYSEAMVDPDTGQATYMLEVLNGAVSPAGLDLKAIWPLQNYASVQNVIPPATPTATPTTGPGTPTSTPVPTSTPGATSTPGPSPTPTATSTPIPPNFTARACVRPDVQIGSTLNASGSRGTLYGLTSPGAICTPNLSYYSVFDFQDYGGLYPQTVTPADSTDLPGGEQVAASDGLVVYPFSQSTTSDFGIATVTCTADSVAPQTGCSAFLISQVGTEYFQTLSGADRRSLLHKIEVQYCPKGSNLSLP